MRFSFWSWSTYAPVTVSKKRRSGAVLSPAKAGWPCFGEVFPGLSRDAPSADHRAWKRSTVVFVVFEDFPRKFRLIQHVMSNRTKKVILLFGTPLGLVALGLFAFFGCPSLWAKDFPVDPAANAHLATTSGLSPEDAALEAIHWSVPVYDRIPRDRVTISVDEQTPSTFVVQVTYFAQDDSYHRMFYEVTLTQNAGSWIVARLRRCWTGRGLTGWSTGIPS